MTIFKAKIIAHFKLNVDMTWINCVRENLTVFSLLIMSEDNENNFQCFSLLLKPLNYLHIYHDY